MLLQPVYFDGDIQIDGLTAGGMDGRVPSKGILGYVQLKPRGEPLSPAALRELLNFQFGSIGAAVDCEINVAGSGQGMRVSRVDISPSVDAGGGSPIFVVAARGALVLSSGGAWSVVRHDQGSGEVSPVDANATVPLIRRGRLNPAAGTTDAGPGDLFRVANPIDLVRPLASDSRNYGLLQTTGTQKALFRQPSFQQGVDQLQGAPPDYADAYRLVNTKGIFPNVQDAVPLALGAFKTHIIKEGYKLIDQANPASVFEQLLPAGPLKLIDESFLKIYVEYEFAKNDKNGTAARPGVLQFGFDAAAAEGQKWLSKVNDIGMVVDLGSIKRLVTIKGRFDAQNGEAPAFRTPELVFSDELQPVIDILQILVELQGGDYAGGDAEGARCCDEQLGRELELCVPRPQGISGRAVPARGAATTLPQMPLKLQAHLAMGVYFNEVARSPTTDVKQLDSHRRGLPGVRRQPVGDVRQPGGGHGVRRWHRWICGSRRDTKTGTRRCTCGSGSAPSSSSGCRSSATCRCSTWWASRSSLDLTQITVRRSCCSGTRRAPGRASSTMHDPDRGARAAINA